jgi:glutaredoxin
MLKLYQVEWCPYCHRVRQVMTELGLTYECVNVQADRDEREELAAVSGQEGVPVLVDGGIRRGADVVKAGAMGARAVLVGRPQLWGLAVAGEAGVAHALRLLRDETDRTMGLLGARCLADIGPDALVDAPLLPGG